jgi:hypothetical protein
MYTMCILNLLNYKLIISTKTILLSICFTGRSRCRRVRVCRGPKRRGNSRPSLHSDRQEGAGQFFRLIFPVFPVSFFPANIISFPSNVGLVRLEQDRTGKDSVAFSSVISKDAGIV